MFMRRLSGTVLSVLLLLCLLAAPLSAFAASASDYIGTWELDSVIYDGYSVPARVLDPFRITMIINSDNTGHLTQINEEGDTEEVDVTWYIQIGYLFLEDEEGNTSLTYIDGKIYWNVENLTYVFARARRY